MISVLEPIDADTQRIRHEFLTRQDLCVPAHAVAAMPAVPVRHAVAADHRRQGDDGRK